MRAVLLQLKKSCDIVDRIADKIGSEAGAALADPNVLKMHETLQGASVVLLSGYLEAFIRGLAESFIRDVCLKAKPFNTLPKQMLHVHFTMGSRLIGMKYGKEGRVSWITASFDDIALRIASGGGAMTTYNLVWEAFANTKGNPGPGVLTAFLSNVGIIKPEVKVTQHSPKGWNWGLFKLQLVSLIEMRNECAHSGATTTPPPVTIIKGYSEMLKKLGDAMVTTLEAHLATI